MAVTVTKQSSVIILRSARQIAVEFTTRSRDTSLTEYTKSVLHSVSDLFFGRHISASVIS